MNLLEPLTLLPRCLDVLAERGETIAAAESLTGGALGAALVDVPGASRVFVGGVVAYQASLKVRLLGVKPETIAEHTTVSQAVAQQMAQGVCRATGAHWGLATTGEAGPTSATGRDVGLLWVACATPHGLYTHSMRAQGGREEVRRAAVAAALSLLADHLAVRGGTTT